MRRSIPTRYRDIRFRSKLEADWARAFDALGVAWEYEREGQYFGDLFYLPDFWLPRSRQYVEVKGVIEPADVRKWMALMTYCARRPHADPSRDICLVIARPGGEFFGYARTHPDAELADAVLESVRWCSLAKCAACAGWWFFDDDHGWACQCCGAHRGRHLLAEIVGNPIITWNGSEAA